MHQFKFQINLKSDLKQLTHLKLFNGYNELLFDEYGEMDVTLKKGIYLLWIEINEHVEQRMYRIDKDTFDQMNEIATNSSMPLSGMSSTHEYFSGQTGLWSHQVTNKEKIELGGFFFLFLRYEDENIPFDQSQKIFKNFNLLNSERKPVLHLSSLNTKMDFGKNNNIYYGSIAYNTSLKNGQYYLVYKEENFSREIPLYIFKDFQTQVFLNVKTTPYFGGLKISISQKGFDINSSQNQQLDALILKMFNGILVFPADVKEIVETGKWENLMLGFLALYIYLLSSKEKQESFYKKYIKQLEKLLPKDKDAPELNAIRLLASVVFHQKTPTKALIYPTMIAKGMQVYLEQSIINEIVIENDSLVQQVLTIMKADSIWTTYEALPMHKATSLKPKITAFKSKSRNPRSGNSLGMSTNSIINLDNLSVDLPLPIQDDTTWITETILHELANQRIENLTIKDLAVQLQVTQNSIRKSLSFLKEKDALEKWRKSGSGFEEIDVVELGKKIKKMK